MDRRKTRDRVYILRTAKKIMSINYLGSKCKECGDDSIFHLTFHHKIKTEKENGICESLEKKWSDIKVELDKCFLLCCNCHQEYHGIESKSTIKSQLLSLRGEDKCCICEYRGKNNASLSFHHKENKEFWLTSKCNYTRNELGMPKELIVEEMKKCILVCENCHRDIHADKTKFERLKDKILEKVANYKESNYVSKKHLLNNNKTKRCDVELCLKLRSDGKTIKEIMKITGYCLNSIQKIFSNNNIFGRIEISRDKVVELWRSGKSIRDISKELNCSEINIYRIMSENQEFIDKRKDALKKKINEEKDVLKKFIDGASIKNLAKQFSFSRTRIRRILNKSVLE